MKVIKKVLFLFAIVCVFQTLAMADIIPEDSHYFSRCVMIEDIDSVGGHKLIMFVNTVTDKYFYEIEKDKCLPGHYKFGDATPYLVGEDKNIDELNEKIFDYDGDQDDLSNFLGSGAIKFDSIGVNGGYISNKSKLTYEKVIYRLVKDDDIYRLDIVQKESDNTGISEIEKYDLDEKSQGDDAISSNKDEQINDKFILGRKCDKLECIPGSKYIYDINYCLNFVIAWLCTIVLETIALFFIIKLFLNNEKIRNGKIFLTGVLASSVTLPILRFVIPLFVSEPLSFVVLGEFFVMLSEIIIMKYLLKISWLKSMCISVVCNLFSFVIGLYIL